MRLLLALALLAAADAGGPPAAGTVTFLSGEATRTAAGRAEALSAGSRVFEGDLLETQARTRLEVQLADASAVRLGPSSKVTLAVAAFGAAPEDRRFSASLALGRIWASVVHAVGGDSRFEVQTENAVAGVRGTAFEVEAAGDGSSAVRVYEGRVAVREPERGGAPPAGRWERVLEPMTELRLARRGAPGQATRFAPAAPGGEEWQSWNRVRDAERKARPEPGQKGDQKPERDQEPGKRRKARRR